MKFNGKLVGYNRDVITGESTVTFSVRANIQNSLSKLKDSTLSVEVKKFRRRRSLDANALLWACIGEIAEALRTDRWSVYLRLLRDYGKYTYIIVKESVVEAVRAQWRECEVVGEVNVNGQKGVQMLCYFGSSTYDTKEFSVLLDGVISEMEQMGLDPPTTGAMQRSLEKWEKMHEEV